MEFSLLEVVVTNFMVALVFFICALHYLVVFGLSFSRRNHRKAFIWLAFLCLAFFIWDLFRGLFCVIENEALAKYMYRLSFIGLALSSPIYFLFAYMYSFSPKKMPTWNYVLFVLPSIAVILTSVPSLHNFFDIYADGFLYTPSRVVVRQPQSFFYIYSAYNYILICAASVLFLLLVIRETENRISRTVICVANFVFVIWNIYTTFFAPQTALYSCLTSFMRWIVVDTFFLSMYFNEDEMLVYRGQQNIFSMLPFPVFIVNNKNKIVYSNFEASLLIPPEQKSQNKILIDDVLNQFQITNMELPPENGGGTIIHVHRGIQDFFLNETKIYSNRKKTSSVQGKLLMFVTQSEFTTFFKDLEIKAFHDVLCSCYNRNFLDIKKSDFVSEKMLPLSFVMCDMDSIKYVNDNFGHNSGDEYISMCADAIRSCTRTTDFIFRIGGDDFLAVLPKTSRKEADDVKARLKLEVEFRGKELGYPGSVSVGVFTVETMPIDFDAALKIVDEQMYEEKKAKRGE